VFAQLQHHILIARTIALLAMTPDTGMQILELAFTAQLDTFLKPQHSLVSVPLQLLMLMPTKDVLLAMHLDIGMLQLKLVNSALKISTGIIQLKNASAALKDLHLTLLTLSVPVLQNILTTMLLLRNVFNAAAPQSGIPLILDALAATVDQHGMLHKKFAFALKKLPSITKPKHNARNALTISPSGTEELVLHAPNTPITTSHQRPALFAQKASHIILPKGHAQLMLELIDYTKIIWSIIFH
jgi:hypothetical protein